MRRQLTLLSLVILGTSMVPAGEDKDEGFESIFDGKTLKGWHVSAQTGHSRTSQHQTGGRWVVEEGAIVGSQDIPGNGGILITDERFGDFEVVLEMNNDFGPDSGLFLRSTEEGKCYQAMIDYHGAGNLMGIYGEGLAGRLHLLNFRFQGTPDKIAIVTELHGEKPPFAFPMKVEEWPRLWKHGHWNELRARIVGNPPTITTWINGVKMMEWTDTQKRLGDKGGIALQVHGGGDLTRQFVRYRNIRVKRLEVGTAAARPVSFPSLLDEMIDRDVLPRFPVPAYTCSQASSYDRGSVTPDQPGWFANMDRSHFERVEEHPDGRKEYVLMDVEGPGAVVRFWATWHGPHGEQGLKEFSNGTLRFYLDNDPQPAIEGPIASILDGGGLCRGPLAQGVSPKTQYGQRGHNLYLPIPYARQCKITYETDVLVDPGAHRGEALYYQINYRTYDAGTSVERFSMQQIADHQDKLEAVQARLLRSGVEIPDHATPVGLAGPLAAGQRRTQVIEQPGAVRHLTIQLAADNLPQALRSAILEICFDGQRTVWCPVGDFFGRSYLSDPHRTWYTEVTEDGRMSCFWVMPYQRQCRISLINFSEQPVDVVQAMAKVGPWTWDDRSMYFHGSWRQLTKVSSFVEGATNPGEGAYDVNYVEVTGRGVYVGDTLAIFNGTSAWWGEGDEKIYVDGESFPSHFGTGTEDYYGYAWCRPEFFEAPFHAQPSGAGNFTPGLSVNSRYRSLDAIPFTTSIQFDMEMWHWRQTIVNFAPAAFWYARPGARWNVAPDPETAALPVALVRSDVVEVFRVPNALEGEDFPKLEMTGGTLEIQEIPHHRWSSDRQVWWRDARVGDRLVLTFPVARAGRYEVQANLTKANDYAVVSVSVNDGPARQFDRYHQVVDHDLLNLGTVELPQGVNRLCVEIVGANEKAIRRHMFGLDYLLLHPRP